MGLKSRRLKLRLGEIGLAVLFLAAGMAVSLTAPLNLGRDELAHFRFTRFIAHYGRLPLTWVERDEAGYKSEWPPLFHLLVGAAGRGIDLDAPPFISPRLVENNPRAQLVLGPESLHSARVLATKDPLQGEVLLWYLGRWLTLLSGLLGAAVSYLVIRRLYPDQAGVALSAAAFLASIPVYLRASALVGYDPLLGVALALYLLLLFYTIQSPARNWLYFCLGLLLGIAALIKYTPLSAVPLVPLWLIWLAYRERWPWYALGGRIVLFVLGLLITFGSWLLYMGLYFNRVAQLGWVSGLLYPFLADNMGVGDVTSIWFANLVTGGELGKAGHLRGNASFFQWGWDLLGDIWGNEWLIWLFLGMLALALAGLLYKWRFTSPPARVWLILSGAQILFLMFFPVFRFVSTGEANTNSVAGQHVIFPIGTPLMLLLIHGLRVWLTPPRLTGLFLGGVLICSWQNIAYAIHLYTPPLPVQAVPLAHEQTLATFDKMSLVGYKPVADNQTLAVTLYWRAESSMTQDYQIELNVLDTAGKPQARWLGQPLNGRYPTRAWWPDDRISDLIYIPIAGLPPGDYEIQLRLLGEEEFVITANISDHSSVTRVAHNDSISLGRMALTPENPINPNRIRLGNREIDYLLWNTTSSISSDRPVYKERATIMVWVSEAPEDKVSLSLVNAQGQAYKAVDHTGHLYLFSVEPSLAAGEYHLRFEQRLDDKTATPAETPPLLRIETPQREFQVGPISHPVKANFAGYVNLLGYDLPERRIQSGGALFVTLHWQALKTIGGDLITFNHLINEGKEIKGGQDRRVRGVYSTFLWAPNEVVTDPFYLQLDPDTPDGIYHLLVGLYLPVGEAPVALPLMQDNQLTDITHVNLGPIKVGHTPPRLTVNVARPEMEINQSFGDTPNVTLLGYDLGKDNCQQSTVNLTGGLRACQLSITFYWRSESPLPIDYTTFVHVRNAAGETVAQKDQPPLNGAYPTSLWDPGEIIADEITIPLPADLAAGSYQLVLGLYDFNTGQRLVVPNNPANEVKLTDVAIR